MIPQANLIITHHCNLLCKHCYMNANNKIKENDELICNNAVNVIDKLVDLNVKKIMITGGECNVSSKLIDILKYIKSKDIEISMFTNGFMFNDSILDYVDNYSLSVDGDREFHNFIRGNDKSYDNVMSTIDKLINNKKNVSIQMTVLDSNIDNLYNNLIDIYSKKIKKVNLCCILRQGRSVDNKLSYDYDYKKLNDIINKVYEDTGYNMYIHTNIYNNYELDNYLKKGAIDFPLWIDLVDNNYYYVDTKFSNNLDYLNEDNLNTIKNDLMNSINKINCNDYIILEDELINLEG